MVERLRVKENSAIVAVVCGQIGVGGDNLGFERKRI